MKKTLMTICAFIMLMVAFSVTSISSEAKVKLNKKTAEVKAGSTVTLKVSGTKKKVKWTTGNKKVATVKAKGKYKGIVTGKKAGKTTITAKVSGKKYKCKLTVASKPAGDDTEKKSEVVEPTEDDTEKKSEVVEPAEDTAKVDAGEYSLDNVHSGKGTYYERVSGGAANLDEYESIYYTVAMNNEDYMNGLAGAYIEITDKDGDKIAVMVTDRLPEGAKGDIDLTKATFEKIEPLSTGKMDITWKIIPLPTNDPIQYVFKPTSTKYWAEIQVRNHRYPIAKLEYLDTVTNTYVELPRQEYNYFTAANGMGAGPYTFRVTDFYGHQLIDSGIEINTTSTPVNGAANFPY
ncbi:MAG: Ig-like domain-containing protein [Lachnospiraceae bacterium]|nr:Ig-like domain-containing protein [Lachnospiraceae bacterium]